MDDEILGKQMHQGDAIPADQIMAQVTDWLDRLERALAVGDTVAASALFVADGHWRDIIAFTDDIRTFTGAAAIWSALAERLEATDPRRFRLDSSRAAPRWVNRAGREAIEAFFAFETRLGLGAGVLRLSPEEGQADLRAWTLLTTLESLRGHEERSGQNRPTGDEFGDGFGQENWSERRAREARFQDRDPQVLVIGAGQAGLAAAACLGAIGVDTLIIDRHARIGDNWRNRYHSLKLHNESWVNHLPYMPYPSTWPTYIAKDKLANWFEAYAESLELNVWTQTEFVGADYDGDGQVWRARVRGPDGAERSLRPKHIVLATGVSGIANRPAIAGLETFVGEVIHSSLYGDGGRWAGRRAIVIGAGNSGHDVAQDLQGHGAEVTMVQRGPIIVASKAPSAQLTYSIYKEGPSTEDCDLLTASIAYPLLQRGYQLRTAEMRELDRTLLDGLSAAGFTLGFGEDDTGYQMSYLRRGGGYYLNVGCSDLIVARKIRLVQHDILDRFETDGVRLQSGELLPADLVVLATGYKPQQELVRRLFGDSVADKVGPIWGFDGGGELRNMWRPTVQQGLWFSAGSLMQVRLYSKYLALQIKARLMDYL